MKKRAPKKKKPAKKKVKKEKITFTERGWIKQIKEFQKKRDANFIWGKNLLMNMSRVEGFEKRRPFEASLDRRLKELHKAGNSEGLRAVIASFIAFNQGPLIRSTLKVLEISGWADKIPHTKYE